MTNSQTVSLNPYLMFNGTCREAMTFYKETLNGELEIMPFEGSPVEVPEDYKVKVLHATLKFGDAVIMASDGMPGQTISQGDSLHLSIDAPNLVIAEQIFKNLSEDGKITMPFEKTFWGAKFGMLTDKFGIHWMVNCDLMDE